MVRPDTSEEASCHRKGQVPRVHLMAQIGRFTPTTGRTLRTTAPLSSRRRRWVRRHRVITVVLLVVVSCSPRCGGHSAPRSPILVWGRACRRGSPNGSAVTAAVGRRRGRRTPGTPITHRRWAGSRPRGRSRCPGATAGRRQTASPASVPPAHLAPPAADRRPSPARRSPARANGTRWAEPSMGCLRSTRRILRPDTVHTSVVVGCGLDGHQAPRRPRCTRGAPSPAEARGTTPRRCRNRAATTLVSRVQRRLLDVQRPEAGTTPRARRCFLFAPERLPSSSTRRDGDCRPVGTRRDHDAQRHGRCDRTWTSWSTAGTWSPG